MFGRFIVADSRRLLTRTMHNSSASRTAPTAVRRKAPARRAISELVRLQEPLAATSFATIGQRAAAASAPRRQGDAVGCDRLRAQHCVDVEQEPQPQDRRTSCPARHDAAPQYQLGDYHARPRPFGRRRPLARCAARHHQGAGAHFLIGSGRRSSHAPLRRRYRGTGLPESLEATEQGAVRQDHTELVAVANYAPETDSAVIDRKPAIRLLRRWASFARNFARKVIWNFCDPPRARR